MASEIVFQSGHRRSLAFERSPICVVTDGIRSPCILPIDVVQEVITVITITITITKQQQQQQAFDSNTRFLLV